MFTSCPKIVDFVKETEVDVVNLGDFIKINNLKIDFIKIDVEGFEFEILNNSLSFLKMQTLIIFIEYISKRLKYLGINNSDFRDILNPLYDCYEIKFPYYNQFPIGDRFKFVREISTDLLCFPKVISRGNNL